METLPATKADDHTKLNRQPNRNTGMMRSQ